jgi:hypothetical protein
MLSVVTDAQTHDELRVDLDQLVREGAQRMLAAALEAEVDDYLAAHAVERDEGGRRLVVRNGHARQRASRPRPGGSPPRPPAPGTVDPTGAHFHKRPPRTSEHLVVLGSIARWPFHVDPHPPARLKAKLSIGRQRSLTDNKGRCVSPPSCRIAPYGAVQRCFPSSRWAARGPQPGRERPERLGQLR